MIPKITQPKFNLSIVVSQLALVGAVLSRDPCPDALAHLRVVMSELVAPILVFAVQIVGSGFDRIFAGVVVAVRKIAEDVVDSSS